MSIIKLLYVIVALVCCIIMIVLLIQQAKSIRKLRKIEEARIDDAIDINSEIQALRHSPIAARGSRWKIEIIGRNFDYSVVAKWEMRWNEELRKIPIILIKRFDFDCGDDDSETYARNCAEELVEKLNEDFEI